MLLPISSTINRAEYGIRDGTGNPASHFPTSFAVFAISVKSFGTRQVLSAMQFMSISRLLFPIISRKLPRENQNPRRARDILPRAAPNPGRLP